MFHKRGYSAHEMMTHNRADTDVQFLCLSNRNWDYYIPKYANIIVGFGYDNSNCLTVYGIVCGRVFLGSKIPKVITKRRKRRRLCKNMHIPRSHSCTRRHMCRVWGGSHGCFTDGDIPRSHSCTRPSLCRVWRGSHGCFTGGDICANGPNS